LLELQGFYRRPVLGSRSQMIWALFKASICITLVAVTWLALIKGEQARGVVFVFGAVGFILIVIKEEIARSWTASRLGSQQVNKRVILIGTDDETRRLEEELIAAAPGEVRVAGRLDLQQENAEALAGMLHEYSANAVII